MKKLLNLCLVCFVMVISSQSLLSQEISGVSGRYIVIDDLSKYFNNVDGKIEVRDFLMYNVLDNESSKPIHVAVNEMNDVIKFSISSMSESVSNTRRCTVIMNAINYQETFRKVLLTMDIKSVVVNGEILNVNDFYTQKLKQ